MSEKIFVITGNTGTGKTTVANYLADFYQMPKVVTHTTRLPRTGEQNGIDYYFESDTSFETMHYLERVEYDHKKYGSSHEGLSRAWEKNSYITIVLDTAGAITYAQTLGARAVIIFMTVSDINILKLRLVTRGDYEGNVAKRLESDEYQRDRELPAALAGVAHVVVNDDWAETKHTIDQIVQTAVNQTD
ncbi:AAA family ATPase [Weissella diestrammenae]|uniref:AAA family ATPase n=1 Tax=Weissella diestrammenae TaxID=1162633 RepID=A0A7G9T6H3_9LACO|nr:AAA family ATPase [Weissella diestrammenae]MCM0583247.1 AAA family ATPase [Weissella diestrammenae]QNN75698.1 AAA family ATPase [Weissella diestrammenae]